MPNAIIDMVGKTLYDIDHEKIGKIDNIYVREPNKEPVFAAVSMGLLGTSETLVPVAITHVHDEDVVADTKKDIIKEAPHINAGADLTHSDEQAFYEYYSDILAPEEPAPQSHESQMNTSSAARPAPNASSESTNQSQESMTRSEEQLRVGTQSNEVERIRLKKYVVTEDVSTTVPLSHEEVRIEREPVQATNTTPPADGSALMNEEREVVLHQETPVVKKEVVPQERIRLVKENVPEQQTIEDQLRKERVDTEHEGLQP